MTGSRPSLFPAPDVTVVVGWLACLGIATAVAACGRGPTAPSVALVPGWSGEQAEGGFRRFDVVYPSEDGSLLVGRLCTPSGEGPFPAVVFHFGSDRWGRLSCTETVGWLAVGMATFTYDKRGTNASQGACCAWQDPGYFPLLAGDVVAGARAIASRALIDSTRIGAYGFSQGGWVVPVAMATAPDVVRWAIIGSGPATTLGEELRFSDLTGDSQCRPSGRTAEEIESLMGSTAASGFDPAPFIAALRHPSLWIYGSLDTSIPVARSVRNLEAIVTAAGTPATIRVIQGINHSWIVNGAMCQLQGPRWDDSTVIVPWLRTVGVLVSLEPARFGQRIDPI